MYMKRAALFSLCLPFIGALVLMSCSPRIEISIAGDSKTGVQVNAAPKPETGALLRSLSAFGGTPAGTQGAVPLFNVDAIKATFLKTGFDTAQAVSPDGLSLKINATSLRAAKVFSFLNKAIIYGPSSLQITLSPDTIPEILALLPRDTIASMDFLMAPLLTGEKMSEADYKTLIASVYGQTIARELSESVFELVFTAPKTISSFTAPSIARAEKQGARITFTVPLASLLAEREKAVYRVEWN
jgi:hypothetical protein